MCSFNFSHSRLFVVRGQPTDVFPKLFKVCAVLTPAVPDCLNIKGQGHSLTLVQGHSDSTFANFSSVETARLIEAKFHVEPPWDWGTNICSNGLGHLTNMVAMPICGKNLKKSSSLEPKGL